MFLTYFHFLPYQPGDETYDLEALISASLEDYPLSDNSSILAYPNPFEAALTLEFPSSLNNSDLIYIYDAQGQLRMKLTPETGTTQLHLGIENQQWRDLPKGVYFVSARIKGQLLSKKLIKF
jgi:hypothetical protein